MQTLDELLVLAPQIIKELASEFVRRGDECMGKDKTSQSTACFLLGLRAISILTAMGLLLKPSTRDSYDVLTRSFMESRDLLLTFRFDNKDIRRQIELWFKGTTENSWKPRHKICDAFIKNLGAGDAELSKRWSVFSVLTHPTYHAATSSAALTVSWVTARIKTEDFEAAMEPKIADYLVSTSTLIVVATFEFKEWIPLGCDLNRMPNVEPFRLAVAKITKPLLDKTKNISLPPGSYRSS